MKKSLVRAKDKGLRSCSYFDKGLKTGSIQEKFSYN